MGEGVVANLVAFAVHALHQADVVLRLLADHEEGPAHMLFLQDVENPRRPRRVRPIVEAEGYLVRDIAGLGHGIRERIRGHRLRGHGAVPFRNRVVVVHGHHAMAGLHFARDIENVAFALEVDVVAGLDSGEVLHRIGVNRPVPDVPQRIVFLPKHPQREGLDA